MKGNLRVLALFLCSMPGLWPELWAEPVTNWNGLVKERLELKLPLLVVKGSQGLLACGYIDIDTCNKTGEACAVVSGVKTHNDMLDAKVNAVSNAAQQLGIEVGMTGRSVLELIR